MKKLLCGIMVTAFIFCAGAIGVFAGNKAYGQRFTDQSTDGVCDNVGTNSGTNFVDDNNDGVCDNIGTNSGANFVDDNNDGVCDNRGANNGICPQNGTGKQHGKNQ